MWDRIYFLCTMWLLYTNFKLFIFAANHGYSGHDGELIIISIFLICRWAAADAFSWRVTNWPSFPQFVFGLSNPLI